MPLVNAKDLYMASTDPDIPISGFTESIFRFQILLTYVMDSCTCDSDDTANARRGRGRGRARACLRNSQPACNASQPLAIASKNKCKESWREEDRIGRDAQWESETIEQS